VIACVKVKQVAPFVDVDEWYYIRPAVHIYRADVGNFLPTQELSSFSRLHEPPLTIDLPSQIGRHGRHQDFSLSLAWTDSYAVR
jgi:hypothetical protein